MINPLLQDGYPCQLPLWYDGGLITGCIEFAQANGSTGGPQCWTEVRKLSISLTSLYGYVPITLMEAICTMMEANCMQQRCYLCQLQQVVTQPISENLK